MAKTILIVDDSTSMRQLVKMTLAGAGHQVIEAVDGRDALAKLGGQKVHLVISDLNMPNLDGLSLAERVSAEVEAKRLPPIQIVMLTTENTKEKVLRAKKAGVLGWIIKPANKEHVLQLAAKLAPLAAA